MSSKTVASPELLSGRRTLDGQKRVEILNDLTWMESIGMWTIHCRLSPEGVERNGLIPSWSDWYILVSQHYPRGEIKVYPGKESGMDLTFPHQLFNGAGNQDLPWRSGKLCLTADVASIGRLGLGIEPFQAALRLEWHCLRALNWLRLASVGALASDGDPFELPDFPIGDRAFDMVVHSEGTDSYEQWCRISCRCGPAEFTTTKRKLRVIAVTCFKDPRGNSIREVNWGEGLRQTCTESESGAWLMLNSCPSIEPFRPPINWQEMKDACKSQNIDIHSLLKPAIRHLRDDMRHVLLVGFPIPAYIGDGPSQIHWQPILLPVLTRPGSNVAGFRANESGYWRNDKKKSFSGTKEIEWIASENWHEQQISSRGSFAQNMSEMKVMLIGAGALGSICGELLVRGGVKNLLIVDHGMLTAGNLRRHTLDMRSVRLPKAQALSSRLNSISPHASVTASFSAFPDFEDEVAEAVQDCQLIIDCSAEDDVLNHMENFPWGTEKVIVSLSMGYQAQRLFCFICRGTSFPTQAFNSEVQPWLEMELQSYSQEDLPREGVGCWHPVFPARVDDIWLLATCAVKRVEEYLEVPRESNDFVVFEQVNSKKNFVGVRALTELEQ